MITCFFALHCIVDLCNSKVGLIFFFKINTRPKAKVAKKTKAKIAAKENPGEFSFIT